MTSIVLIEKNLHLALAESILYDSIHNFLEAVTNRDEYLLKITVVVEKYNW